MRMRKKYVDVWPIDPMAAKKPEGWKGWPEGKQFALVLTHDVDTQRGQGIRKKSGWGHPLKGPLSRDKRSVSENLIKYFPFIFLMEPHSTFFRT